MLRTAVISDTDSVTGDALVNTDKFGTIRLDELETQADTIEYKDNKTFYFFDTPLNIDNVIDGNIIKDEVDFLYSHDVEKDIYEIELEDGKTIKVTEDHSIMTCNSAGEPLIEKKPFELTENDICIVID